MINDKQVQFWGPEHSDGAAPPQDFQPQPISPPIWLAKP